MESGASTIGTGASPNRTPGRIIFDRPKITNATITNASPIGTTLMTTGAIDTTATTKVHDSRGTNVKGIRAESEKSTNLSLKKIVNRKTTSLSHGNYSHDSAGKEDNDHKAGTDKEEGSEEGQINSTLKMNNTSPTLDSTFNRSGVLNGLSRIDLGIINSIKSDGAISEYNQLSRDEGHRSNDLDTSSLASTSRRRTFMFELAQIVTRDPVVQMTRNLAFVNMTATQAPLSTTAPGAQMTAMKSIVVKPY